MTRPLARLIAFCAGFVSLGMEILWVRMVGFAGHATPKAFAFVLTAYIGGIALGAVIGRELCRTKRDFWLLLAALLLAAPLGNLACVALFVFLFGSPWITPFTAGYAWIGADMLILLSAATTAILFPIVHHLVGGRDSARLGRSLSLVYGANILGSALGPLATNFGLLALMSTQQSVLALQAVFIPLSVVCVARVKRPRRHARAFCAAALAGVAGLLIAAVMLPDVIFARLADRVDGQPPAKIIETNRGVVAAYHREKGGDVVYGDNVYDGKTNLDPVVNSNGIDRILILAALAQKPRHALVVGLSSGTWVALLTSFPGLESIDVAEINQGYLQLIADYPPQKKALSDPRVHVHIADGIQWLREQGGRRFDLVIMNTTWNWRIYSTNLLSLETMRLLQEHMTPDALLAFNTTWSLDAFATAAAVFPYAVMRDNFVIASDSDFLTGFDKMKARRALMGLRLDGKPLYYDGPGGAAWAHANVPFNNLAEAEAHADRPLEIITRDNMLTEYKYGKRLF